MPKVRLDCLDFAYRKKKETFPILSNLSYAFDSGKTHVVLGRSGCGKTTLLRCITGLADYQGHILFDDIEIDGMPTQERNIGYVSQEFGLYPHFDLFTSIAYPLRIAGADVNEIRVRVNEIAKELGIQDILSRKPKQVSVGQAQRAALARALIKRPGLLLLDEPLSNVDEQTRRDIICQLKDYLHRYGITAIYVCHDIGEATSLADVLHVMDEGKFILSGDPLSLMQSQDIQVNSLFEAIKNETV